jgi:hypothetical protein
MKSLLRGLLVLAVVWMTALPMRAAAEPVLKAEAVAGFGGYAKAGKWVPAEVTIQNDGAEFEGVIRFLMSASMGGQGFHKGIYDTPVVVPAGSTKRVQLALPLTEGGIDPTLKLMVGDEVISEIPFQLETAGELMVIGVLGVEPSELTGLAGKVIGGRKVRLVQLDSAHLPSDPLLLENLDGVLLDRFAYSELPEPQRLALQGWVEQGGVLIAAAGPEANRLEGLSPWISLPITGLQTVQVPGVGIGPLSQVEARGGWQVERAAGAQPLALRLEKGRGSVHLLTFDPALEPFASWQGLPDVLAPMLPSLDAAMGGGMPMGPMGKANMVLIDSLHQFPVREIPSAKPLLILLGIYALVLGPVHLLLLRGFRRVGWALLTLPILISAGGVGAWAFTKKANASDIMATAVAVLEGQPGGGSMRINMLAGLFMPPGSKHRIAMGDALLSPVPLTYFMIRPDRQGALPDLETTFAGGREAQLKPREEWGMQAVAAEAVAPAGGHVSGVLTLDTQMLKGTLTNHLPFALKGVLVATGTSFVNVGDVGPGETVDVQLMASAFAQQWGGDNPLAEVIGRAYQFAGSPNPTPEEYKLMRRQQMGWAAANVVSWARSGKQPPAVLIGWTEESALPLTVDGRKLEVPGMSLYAQPLSVVVSDGEFTLPSSMVSGRLVEMSGVVQGGLLRPGWSMGKGEAAVLEFDVPSDLVKRVKEIEVKVPSLGGMPNGQNPVELSIFRWTDSTWHPVNDGEAIADPAFISPTGTVRAKVVQVTFERMPLGQPGLTVRGKGVTP